MLPRERVQQRTAKQTGDFAHGVIEDLIASLEREAENNKKVAEREWLDLMPFLKNRWTEIEEQLVLLAKRAWALCCWEWVTRMAAAGSRGSETEVS